MRPALLLLVTALPLLAGCPAQPSSSAPATRASGSPRAPTSAAREAPTWPATPEAAACKAQLERTERQFQEAIAAAPKACAADTDCVVVQAECWTHCDSPAITASSRAEYARATAPAQAECAQFYKAGCPALTPLPMPSCAAPPPHGCKDGQCR